MEIIQGVAYVLPGFESTYKELKLYVFPVTQSFIFSFESTYKELKLRYECEIKPRKLSFESTYKELKFGFLLV